MALIPIHVLIVDDEVEFADALGQRLEVAGNRVTLANSGQDALKQLADSDVDVVILDLKMPGMDGMEVLRQIKADHPLVEVILLTGHGAIEDAVEGLKNGAFDFLQKPTDREELLAKLAAASRRKAEQEERIRSAEARRLVRKTGDI